MTNSQRNMDTPVTGSKHTEQRSPDDEGIEPDWDRDCIVCGQTPVVPLTGMCGPCTFGESETAGGNW